VKDGPTGARPGNPNVVRQARGRASRRGFFLALLVVAVAGVGAITWAMQRARAPEVVVVPDRPRDPNAPRPEGYVRGDSAAPVEIVEYADFECPGCAQFATVTEPDVVSRLVSSGQARFRLYDFQVTAGHRASPAASLAAACANDQGKFWEMHDRLFAGQNDWRTPVPGYDGGTDDPRPVFAGYAQALGLDVARWSQCYDGRQHVARLAAHRDEAVRAGVQSTPTLLVGNRKIEGVATFDAIKALVDSARAAAPAPAPAAAPGAGR
jgi:protein-disulfide isomerase